MSEYKITPINKIIKIKTSIPKHMPQPIFRLAIYANSFSGKSTLICNLLKKNKFGYNKYFGDNIFLFSKTIDADDTYDCLDLKPENIKNNVDIPFIEEMINEQTENIKKYGKQHSPPCLLIFEDLVTDITNNDDIMKRIFFQGRHFLFNIIITSQTYHALPKNYRLNTTHIVLYQLPDKDIKSIIDEISISKKDLLDFYEEATKEKYNFLYINLKDKKFYKNFEYELTT
jgi:hypothetical protein